MAFTAEELQGFHNLVDAMGSFKNRNSRVIGTQFNDLPGGWVRAGVTGIWSRMATAVAVQWPCACSN